MVYSTPPWTALRECLNSVQILDASDREIGSAMVEEEDEVSAETLGNAQLMALAPEMYAQLLALQEWFNKTDAIKPNYDITAIRRGIADVLAKLEI